MTGPSRITPSGIWSTWKEKAPSADALADGPKTRCFGALGVLPSSSGGIPGRMSSVDVPLVSSLGSPRTFSGSPPMPALGSTTKPVMVVPSRPQLIAPSWNMKSVCIAVPSTWALGATSLSEIVSLLPVCLRFHSSVASEAASVSTSRPLTRKWPLVVQTVVRTPDLSVVTPWKQPAPPATSAPWVTITARSTLITGLSTQGASLTVRLSFAVAVAPSSSVTRTLTVAGPFLANVAVASANAFGPVSIRAVAVEVEGVGGDASVRVRGLRAEQDRLARHRRGAGVDERDARGGVGGDA